MAAIGPRELDLSWIVFAHHGLRVDHRRARDAGHAALPARGGRRGDLRARSPASTLGDLTWYHVYNAVQWCIVFMRTGARSIHFGEIERPDDIETLMHHKPLMESHPRRGGGLSDMVAATLDEYPIHQAPLPVTWAGVERPQLLRPLLLQRPRPHRRHLPHHRPRLLPQPRHQGRVRPGPPRRRADRRPPLRRRSTTTGSTSTSATTASRSLEPLQQAPGRARGDRGHRRRPDLGGLLRRPAGAAARDALRQPGHPRRPALRPGRHLERPHRRSTATEIAVDARHLGRHPRPLVGHPPGRRGGARRGARRPAVRGHVVALRADALRRLRDRA